ncbi:metallo-hydrolase/oxidoreductase superfamily protein, partial [Tanacetum coccineum]
MGSRTTKPFHTTNLIMFALGSDNIKFESGPFVAQEDAMIVDPGCQSEFNNEDSLNLVIESNKLKADLDHVPNKILLLKAAQDSILNTLCLLKLSWAVMPIDVSQSLLNKLKVFRPPGAAFIEVELEYDCVKSVNRRKQKTMHRVWVHGKFQKPIKNGQAFSLDATKQKAIELETDGSDDLDFGLTIL